MDQLKKLLAALSLRQKIGIAAVALLLAGGMAAFVHWNRERNFRPLFTGMSPEDAAGIVQKLKESGVDHRLSDNGSSVLVPAAKLDELRLQMAAAGLPKTGRIGFELFDKTNLGITDFTEHVNYRRALEGELERSIKAISEVEQARVHVTFPKDSVFLESREPAKASVLIRLRAGAQMRAPNVLAISRLVASAVEGLTPENVSVVDTQGNLLSKLQKPSVDGSDLSEATLDYKRQIEKDLMAKVENTLDPLLGPGKFRIGLSVDCDFSMIDQSDEVFDPSRSVMTNSQKSEDISGIGQNAGVPGTPSNLPRPTSRPVSSSGPIVSHRTENISYETSRTVKHTKTPQGAIRRISASVLLDQDLQWEGKGNQLKRVLVPPSPERLKAIHGVVAAVLGIATERGDQLVIESLAFEETLASQPPPQPVGPDSPVPGSRGSKPAIWLDRRVQIGAGAALLVVVAGVVFLLLRRKKAEKKVEMAAELPAPATSASARPSLESAKEDAVSAIEEAARALDEQLRAELAPGSKNIDVLRQRARNQVKKDPVMVANILRGWVQEVPGRTTMPAESQ